jgi:isoquinoline 1-oxidoreductase beta subunit
VNTRRIAAMLGDIQPRWNRRTFLATGVAAGGLLVAARWVSVHRQSGEAKFAPDLYVRIDADNRITLTVPKSEMGQGVRTALSMLIAEELEAEFADVHVETAKWDMRYGDQDTGGSGSVLDRFDPLRKIGAAMRGMLIASAAARWNVPAAELRAEKSHVIHSASARRASFGELAADAAKPAVPQDPPLKPRGEWTLIGREQIGKDVPDIVHGRARYGIDQRLPGMLFASIERPREFGATVESFDATDTLKLPGVKKVIELKPVASAHVHGGIAVVAIDSWTAMQARKSLKIRWKPGPYATETSAALAARMAAAVEMPGRESVNRAGDPESELAKAEKVIRADYTLPFLAHATMEPMNCTAHWDGRRMTLWSPTQFPDTSAREAAKALGLDADQVTVNVALIGGGFGRRINSDYSVEAALVARELDVPVQVIWSREDDFGHDFYRPCAHHRFDASLDANGFPHALRHRLCNPSIRVTYRGAAAKGLAAYEGEGIADSFYRVPNRVSEYTLLDSGVPRGWWRAVTTTHTIFAIESFIDELAEAAQKDPLEYRLALIGTNPFADPDQDKAFAFSPERMKHCLALVGEKAGWNQPPAPDLGRGLACCTDHLSYSALVVEASVRDGRVAVNRVVCVVDCGTVVNPNGARAQVEGAITQGLSAALHERITIGNGGAVETNFDRYPLLRFPEAPVIEVHFVDRPDVRVTGLGEPALPPVAPALANALYRVTGKRLRELPLHLA